MANDLGTFAESFATWRKVLAGIPEVEDRWTIFETTAQEIASYVAKGLDRTVAADELQTVAEAYGLVELRGPDDVQMVIADALVRSDETAERVPDLDVDVTNGRARQPLPSATLYVFPDPALIPPRAWLYGGHYVRHAATATVAPGGFWEDNDDPV